MYCIEQTVVSGPTAGIWYLTEDMTWSDDPKRARRMSKKDAEFWLGITKEWFRGNIRYTNRIVDIQKKLK